MVKKLVRVGVVVLSSLALLCAPNLVSAQGVSNNFRIDESQIGPGSTLQSTSTTFSMDPGLSSLQNGGLQDSTSTNYQVKHGSTTTPDPSLGCTVNTSSISFGAFSNAAASTATATFKVLNYTSYGYIVSLVGATPSNGTHNLTGMGVATTSSPGTEQFGVNLVANTSPTTFGTNPTQVPSGSFSYGAAATNYNTPNNFRYVSGDTVASATKSSGETDYTISYIVNVATTTGGGAYTGNQTVVCTGTY